MDSLGLDEAVKIHATLWLVFSARKVQALPAEQRSLLDPGFAESAKHGEKVSIMDLVEAMAGLESLGLKMKRFHERYDLILAPTFPVTAPDAAIVPKELKGPAAFTCPFNLTKQPAASVPCGLTSARLPVGLQIIGPIYRDDLVLKASRAYEAIRGEFPRPPLVGVNQ